jgi:2-polyprenyl-6-methoxyphenol hydroxylase-like FAD-dependent oxidoreductase
LSDARKNLEGWDPIIHKILDLTPDPVIDWKLVYRIALIGDAAHPFLPTSIQGASQAMEDGVTIAVCLRKAGKENVQEALSVFEALRYERVRGSQKTGETTRDRWHKADWDEVRKNPQSMELQREEWILNFDAEKHAEKNYSTTLASIRDEKRPEANLHLPISVNVSA